MVPFLLRIFDPFGGGGGGGGGQGLFYGTYDGFSKIMPFANKTRQELRLKLLIQL